MGNTGKIITIIVVVFVGVFALTLMQKTGGGGMGFFGLLGVAIFFVIKSMFKKETPTKNSDTLNNTSNIRNDKVTCKYSNNNTLNEYDSMENPIQKVFKDLRNNQKMSIMNLLATIADGEQRSSVLQEKVKFLNSYIIILDVRNDICRNYFKTAGGLQMIDDLNTLPQSKKEFLVSVSYDLLNCGGKPKEEDISFTINLFEKFGIDENKFVQIIEKNHAAMKNLVTKQA